ncbi:carboxyl transferase domain-containing protein [Jatrophihabitans sp. DSM 45814]
MTAELGTGSPVSDLNLIEEWDTDLSSADPLGFPGYQPPKPDDESVRTGVAKLGDTQIAVIECRFDRHGGTMGAVTGERIVRAFGRAADQRLPLAAVVASGGARLQEGMVSLIQMARTTTAVSEFARAGLLWAAVYTPHTTGGVYSSWASLADIRGAQPGSTIGFGGPRVVAEVTGSFPPADSHTAESAYTHGLVDALVTPEQQLGWFAAALTPGAAEPLALPGGRPRRPGPAIASTNAWEVLQTVRSQFRPSGLEWAAWLTDGWVELRGSDPTIRAGLSTIGGLRVMVVAMDRHAYGDAAARQSPAAFRLAQRAIRLASRLSIPVLTLIDTPGAEPGPAAEADGIAGEIARTLLSMAELEAPSVALCVGEGGSGGAMALAHADRFMLLSGSVFSVIGPQAGAAILYRDSGRAAELAEALRILPIDLVNLRVADSIIDEDHTDAIRQVREAVVAALTTAEIGYRNTRASAATRRALNTP